MFLLFQEGIFRFHVSFQGCISIQSCPHHRYNLLAETDPPYDRPEIAQQNLLQKNLDFQCQVYGIPNTLPKTKMSHEKNPLTFHDTGWLIGILITVYYNPYITG